MSRKARISLVQFVTFCFVNFFLSLSQAEVTLTVGKGSAFPGDTESPVVVSLENQGDEVKGVQMDICDEGNFLALSASAVCETTERTTGFLCLAIEKGNGCCTVMLISLSGNLIGEGTGPILTLKYDVPSGVPSGCRELSAENVLLSDKINKPLGVITEPGSFCLPCTSDLDCNDGLFCNGDETCSGGTCQPGTDPCEIDKVCDERHNLCTDACEEDSDCDDGDACTNDACGAWLGCEFTPIPGCECDEDSDCSDNDLCTGQETCDVVNNKCLAGITLNCDDGNVCTDDSCDAQAGCQHVNNTSGCDDGNVCTEDTCDPGSGCIHTTIPGCVTTTTTIYVPPPPPPPPPKTTTTTTSVKVTSSTTTTSSKPTTTTTMPSPPPTTTTITPSTTTTTVPTCCPVVQIYGEDSMEVQLLRFVRDNVLSRTQEGREVIEFYYKLNPIIMRAMEEDETFAEWVKSIIDDIMLIVQIKET